MKTLILNIKALFQTRENDSNFIAGPDMKILPTIKDAFLLIGNDKIIDYGPMDNCPSINPDRTINANGKFVLPAWCDSHSHIVYAGNREQEFVDRINGLSYEEIASRGGGILNSAKKLREASEYELFEEAMSRVYNVMKMGTGCLEIKSGYGLSVDSELKMLRVIKRIKKYAPIKIKSTFLGAHAIPENYRNNKEAYIDVLINEMLPEIVEENLADYIDVFCEKGYFSLADTDRILSAGSQYGLTPKIHVNQFNAFGGVEVAVKHKALSVDHLEELNEQDLMVLKGSRTIAVALPSCSFFINIPYTPARKIIDSNLPLALATDYNPGTTPSGNMNFVLSLACIKMNLTPEEAINAATVNGAYAMGCSNDYGSISKGKKANLIITKKVPSIHYLPYAFGENHIDQVLFNGEVFE